MSRMRDIISPPNGAKLNVTSTTIITDSAGCEEAEHNAINLELSVRLPGDLRGCRGPPSEYLKKRLASEDAGSNRPRVHHGQPSITQISTTLVPSPTTLLSLSPLSSHSFRTSSTPNSLESVLARDVAMYIFSLFFDYVHPLTPCLHRPTFLLEVENRRDEQDPVFLALVLSVLASAIVQIPKALLPPIDGIPAREMAGKCYQVSRLVSIDIYDPPTIELVITRFLDAIYHLISGRLGAQAACLGEALQLGVALGLHKEASYAGLDPISAEVRRRTFALIFTSDKSAACLRDRPIFLDAEECDTLMPREVDDEYITRTEYLDFPPHATSTIAGFNIVTKIFKVIGDALILRRRLRQEGPLTPEQVLAYLRRIASISDDLTRVLLDIPSGLRLTETPVALEIPGSTEEWGQDMLAQLDVYFSQAYQSRSIAKESFLVLKGNIYVTHALARYVLLKCRDEVIERANPSDGATTSVIVQMISRLGESQDKYESIVLDLLKALHSIPIQNLAVNGPSLVNKVRYVAVSLLDALDARDPVSPEGAYLLDFLGILSEIEQTL
nr:uncharacterized protein CI109_006680 [Kwoniella shandongensis]KAA5524956.1 hypothetical protein CI109_006680 [Kwoniella shandongensis]